MRRRAFTLVELLVVVTVIVVLLSLMAPALNTSIELAQRTVCASHLDQVGIALHMYLTDYKGRYPSCNWAGLFGSAGTNAAIPDVTGKPLNAHLGYRSDKTRTPIAYCPADNGDAFHNIEAPVWRAWGTSYLETLGGNRSRTDWVFAIATSKKHSSFNPLHNKVIIGDAVWHANEGQNAVDRRWWHAPTGRKLYNMLFADGHAALTDMDDHPDGPQTVADDNKGGNPSAPYW